MASAFEYGHGTDCRRELRGLYFMLGIETDSRCGHTCRSRRRRYETGGTPRATRRPWRARLDWLPAVHRRYELSSQRSSLALRRSGGDDRQDGEPQRDEAGDDDRRAEGDRKNAPRPDRPAKETDHASLLKRTVVQIESASLGRQGQDRFAKEFMELGRRQPSSTWLGIQHRVAGAREVANPRDQPLTRARSLQ